MNNSQGPLLPARIANELQQLRNDCLSIQEAFGSVYGTLKVQPSEMHRIQRIDYVTQALDDLARVTTLLNAPDFDCIDEVVGEIIQLRDLRARLTRRLEDERNSSHREPIASGSVTFF